MPMMRIWIVNMSMPHRRVAMPVGVRLRDRSLVGMLVVLIVNVAMLVVQRLMRVLVVMPFGQVQPQTDAHQCAGNQ
jgi:hypothetical protein